MRYIQNMEWKHFACGMRHGCKKFGLTKFREAVIVNLTARRGRTMNDDSTSTEKAPWHRAISEGELGFLSVHFTRIFGYPDFLVFPAVRHPDFLPRL